MDLLESTALKSEFTCSKKLSWVQVSSTIQWLGRKRQVWFIALANERGVCRWNCEIPWERVSYLSALQVWSWQGAIQIYKSTFTFTFT